jgi:hypothetical protein
VTRGSDGLTDSERADYAARFHASLTGSRPTVEEARRVADAVLEACKEALVMCRKCYICLRQIPGWGDAEQ